MYKYKYSVLITWSDVDKCYIGKVLELDGCMTDGETVEELMENVNEAIKVWIETAQDYNMEIPEPKSFIDL